MYSEVYGLRLRAQAVVAVARREERLDFWTGVLTSSAAGILLLPVLAIPLIFGGLRSRRLRDLNPQPVRTAARAVSSARRVRCHACKRHLWHLQLPLVECGIA